MATTGDIIGKEARKKAEKALKGEYIDIRCACRKLGYLHRMQLVSGWGMGMSVDLRQAGYAECPAIRIYYDYLADSPVVDFYTDMGLAVLDEVADMRRRYGEKGLMAYHEAGKRIGWPIAFRKEGGRWVGKLVLKKLEELPIIEVEPNAIDYKWIGPEALKASFEKALRGEKEDENGNTSE